MLLEDMLPREGFKAVDERACVCMGNDVADFKKMVMPMAKFFRDKGNKEIDAVWLVEAHPSWFSISRQKGFQAADDLRINASVDVDGAECDGDADSIGLLLRKNRDREHRVGRKAKQLNAYMSAVARRNKIRKSLKLHWTCSGGIRHRKIYPTRKSRFPYRLGRIESSGSRVNSRRRSDRRNLQRASAWLASKLRRSRAKADADHYAPRMSWPLRPVAPSFRCPLA
jgi:hypothetical protein